MKSIPRISSFLKRVNQIAGMENVSFLVIIRRICVYLKEIFLEKCSLLIPVSKQVIADFTALFIICAVIIVVLIISLKWSKNKKNIHTDVLSSENMQLIDGTDERRKNYHESIYDLPRLNHRPGDGLATEQKKIPRRKRTIYQKPRPHCLSIGSNISRHSGFSIKLTQSQHSPTSQRKNKTSTSSNNNNCQTWLIRRTRSGQIYGKYPI